MKIGDIPIFYKLNSKANASFSIKPSLLKRDLYIIENDNENLVIFKE
jgi:hypothetical protein